MRQLSDTAADKFENYLASHPLNTTEQINAMLDYAYALATKYGEGATELACKMYDGLAELVGANVETAEPAATATYSEVAKAVNGTRKIFDDNKAIAQAVGRLVKMAGVDTTMQNAIRDGAEWAWIPNGDTCAFCIALAANGWQNASPEALKGGHASHIHSNCDCTYAVRWDKDTTYAGYDPERYKQIYDSADGGNSGDKVNAIRRKIYQQNKDYINAQKRALYKEKQEALGKIVNAYGSRDLKAIIPDTTYKETKAISAFFSDASKGWLSSLTDGERQSITDYTDVYYRAINGKLRKTLSKNLLEGWEEKIDIDRATDNISNAIKNYRLNENIVVYRNCDDKVFEKIRQNVGGVFKDDGFTSTSVIARDRKFAGNYRLAIDVPAGTGVGAYINDISKKTTEYEFLLQKGTSFRVDSITEINGETWVRMTAIGNDVNGGVE